MFETLPGFREFYPAECSRRNHLFRVWKQRAFASGFAEYDAPLLEPLELYIEKSGEEIVSQLFNFTDKGGRNVALRPELTPSLARMIGGRANSLKRPLKWFCIGENFRYEKPQKGRLRSHYQFNADILGEPGPGADAELIALLLTTLRTFGLTPHDIVLRLSDRNLWMHFLASMGIVDATALSVLATIDKMEREPRETTCEKLSRIVEHPRQLIQSIERLIEIRSLEDLHAFFSAHRRDAEQDCIGERLAVWEALISSLEGLGVAEYVRIDLGVVRGLAYYTGFVFEVFEIGQDGMRGRAIAGGGRYDTLVKKLGYSDMPAVGFGMGDVVLADLLDERGLLPECISKPDLYVVAGTGLARKQALSTVTTLRDAGFRVEYSLRHAAFGKQFRAAGESGALFAIIIGDEEASLNQAKLRDMTSGIEYQIASNDLLAEIQQRFT